MSKTLRGRLLAALFTGGIAAAAAAPASGETLSDAVALAYETNPTLQAQRATQRAIDEEYVQARTGWRPTLQLQAVGTYDKLAIPHAAQNFLTQSAESNAGSLALTFTQPIWTGGRTAANVSAAQADILQGRENVRRVESQVLVSVIQGYMDVLRDEEGLKIRQEDLVVLQKQLDESRARFDVGEITRTDVAESEARLAAAKALLQTAQAQLAISRANYASVVGQNPGDLAPEPSLAYLLPSDPDQAFMVAEQYSPQLRAQEFAEQGSRARVAAARANRLPNLSVQGTLRFSNGPLDPFRQNLYQRDEQVNAVLTVPLFTGGLTSSQIRQAIERNNADRISIETQRRGVLQAISQTWNQLIAARANIASDTEQVRAAEIAAEGTREELSVGLRTTIDVLNADVELRNAQLSLVAARHDEYVAAATLLAAMGRLEAKDLIPSVPRYDPRSNYRRLRITWGWVPWEEPIGIVDRYVTFPPIPQAKPLPQEKPIPPGLQPPPSAAAAAAPKR
ncbi:MAG TPA: TolC family outer membrane protein [Phenylobacterium sp.]|uniref:TolC family outer membrane protein n=1 Tax=Phenylobacterium sp. TaxID=1871053 RepID=UPI002CE9DB6A|nr:TolC family outer membrane protein [Phenylobacterium sp.]HSV02433.1 TolC family outer membrane protein [Phenylobacterium sp.]